MNIQLPEPLASYFDQDDGEIPGRVDELFAADAIVVDEGRTYRGPAAIAAWKREAKAKYRYRVEPLSFSREGDTAVVRARVRGDFPGSPADLEHRFTLSQGRIASLEIRA